MKWQKGRQNAGYSKLKLWTFWRMDGYILKFPKGTTFHFDKTDGRHFRFNLTLKGFWKLILKSCEIPQNFLDSHLFRPDIEEHSANFLEDTYVFSFGFKL